MTFEDDKSQYFVRSRGRITGPFSVEQLQKLHSRGRFSRFHEVSEDRANWMPASSLEDVFKQQSSVRNPDDVLMETFEDANDAPSQASSPPPLSSSQSSWYYTVDNEQHGPLSTMELRQLIASGQLLPNDQVWREGMQDWEFIQNVSTLYSNSESNSPRLPAQQNVAPRQANRSPMQSSKSRMSYVLLGFFCGLLGLHNFYAGYTARGMIQLLLTICIIPIPFVAIWVLIEICVIEVDATGMRFS